jgi:RNA polymerase sigma-70 factor (ECF subfamily)
VEQLIDQLPMKCRRVFVLRRIHNVSQREIAGMFGISESAVEKLAMRGLKLILKAMEGNNVTKELEEEIDEHAKDRTRSR